MKLSKGFDAFDFNLDIIEVFNFLDFCISFLTFILQNPSFFVQDRLNYLDLFFNQKDILIYIFFFLF